VNLPGSEVKVHYRIAPEHWQVLSLVFAAFVTLAFAMLDSLWWRLSGAWSMGVKVMVFVVLAYLTLWWWPASRRRRALSRFCRRTLDERRAVGPGKVSSALSRVDLVKELQHRVRASSDLPLSVRIELREVLERLKSEDEDDTRAIAAWQFVRDAAPRIWDQSKPVRDALIGETVKRALGQD